MVRGVLKFIAGLLIVAVIIECSALLATVYASRQITAAFQQSMISLEAEEVHTAEVVSRENMTAIDFYKSTGISETALIEWFDTVQLQQQLDQIRLVVTLSDESGNCLVDHQVALQWHDGIEWRQIGNSGLAEFALTARQLKDLQVIVPNEFQTLRQRTFAMGDHYERPPQLTDSNSNAETVNDDAIQQELFRNLQKVRSKETVFNRLNAAEALKNPETPVEITVNQAVTLTSEEIYERCRQSVVVIGMLHPDGMISQGTGFVLNTTGVIVTNFHVVNKPKAVAAGVLTSDHRFFEIREFLAGNPSDDLALIRVDAVQLPAIPVADRDTRIGADLLAISHPDSHYFSMTFGRTTRYFQTTRHAMPSLRMGVTADFSEGSSGGPLLDVFGNVVGVVSATRGNASQMIHREAIPVSSLRKLTGNSTQWEQTSTEPVNPLPQSGH